MIDRSTRRLVLILAGLLLIVSWARQAMLYGISANWQLEFVALTVLTALWFTFLVDDFVRIRHRRPNRTTDEVIRRRYKT